jgi:hypothetical protein
MNAFRRIVVAALLAVWCFPAVSMAKSAPRDEAPLSAPAGSNGSATVSTTNGGETESLATREQKAQQLQDFKGGGVVIIAGSGAMLVVVVILLILLV